MKETLLELLQYGLPSGFITSLITWIVTKRQRNNDMLSALQKSINMLVDENTKVLEENIKLRKEKVALESAQEELRVQLSALTKEVEKLRKIINKQVKNNEKNNTDNSVGIADNSVRNSNKTDKVQKGKSGSRNRLDEAGDSHAEQSSRDSNTECGVDAGEGSSTSVEGGDDDSDDGDIEPA